jgi:SAM-dependent methyltransferase
VTTSPVYDEIGIGYSLFRRPDPRIDAVIQSALGTSMRVLNVGAGTGSYEPAGRMVVAVEPSPEMIRQRPRSAAPCLRGHAADLPFEDGEFDAAMAVLTVHHWTDPASGLRELRRVANAAVILAIDPPVHNSFWLFRDYLPEISALSTTGGAMPVDAIAEVVGADRVETVLIPRDCFDGFGVAYWCRPDAYLDPDVRRCISAFGLVHPDAVSASIDRLREDLRCGAWHDRYGDLLERETFDGGLRLIVRDAR